MSPQSNDIPGESPDGVALSELQLDVMRVLWRGEASVAEVAAALAEWFENAIGAPDGVKHDEIQRAAHFLSDPVVEGRTSLVQADFGTADVHVVMALFDTLRLAGAYRVEFGLPDE